MMTETQLDWAVAKAIGKKVNIRCETSKIKQGGTT